MPCALLRRGMSDLTGNRAAPEFRDSLTIFNETGGDRSGFAG